MKSFKAYIREFLIFLLVIFIFTFVVVCGEYIQVIIKPHFISYLILLSFVFSIVFSYRRIIRDGVASIIDCLFRTECETKAIFIESCQDFGSTFSDRFTNEGVRTFEIEVRYIYIFYNKKKLLLRSLESLDIVPQKKYRVVYGKFSKIILSICDD